MILRAEELSFSPPPRCPTCGVGLLPYGRGEPFAVDSQRRPYCRTHGPRIDPDFTRVHDDYARELRARSAEAFRILRQEPST
jgi:hypothetical protein